MHSSDGLRLSTTVILGVATLTQSGEKPKKSRSGLRPSRHCRHLYSGLPPGSADGYRLVLFRRPSPLPPSLRPRPSRFILFFSFFLSLLFSLFFSPLFLT